MTAAKLLVEKMSLRRAISYAGVSRSSWYRKSTRRHVRLNEDVLNLVRRTGYARPTYGTRRMAAEASRHLGRPINRKQIRRIYAKLGWNEPKKTKKEIIVSRQKLVKPSRPDELWEMDMTYVKTERDGNCYCFNILDVFTRRWISYSFDTNAGRQAAVDAVINALAVAKPDCRNLVIRTDNGSQFVSRAFRDTLKVLGIQQEFIMYHTLEQNGHVESFHKTLKKEYLWPRHLASYQDAEGIIADAFADYNQRRIHSALGYATPEEFARTWRMK